MIHLKEIQIKKNESNQRIDRFLKKYLSKAPSGFIFKMLRKKRIKLNGKKAKPEQLIREGDKIQFYLSDETIDKFREGIEISDINVDIDIIYEDKNIVLINKEKGLLSHSADSNDNNTVVKQLISYLHNKGEYDPEKEKTFVPSICNRLDRNTSGIIIGSKNYSSLQIMNEAIRRGSIKKIYKCIVKGEMKGKNELTGYLVKNKRDNKVFISNEKVKGSKKIHTIIKSLKNNKDFSLLEVDLITGRTHQIRVHLCSIGHPIIGDPKYGDKRINDFFRDRYGLNSQFLHAYKIVLDGLSGELEYLNGKEFTAELSPQLNKIEKHIFTR